MSEVKFWFSSVGRCRLGGRRSGQDFSISLSMTTCITKHYQSLQEKTLLGGTVG